MRTAFDPGRLGSLQLRNRILKAATYEGMTPGGQPTERLIAHHRALAAGGVAMTTVAYCAVCPDGRTFEDQLCMNETTAKELRRLTNAVHSEGAAASLQLGHAGFFTKNQSLGRRRPLAPSTTFNAYGVMSGLPLSSPMSVADMRNVIDSFRQSAERAAEAGFDAIELHLGHGYLLSQFLSPATNRRRDEYGGSITGRLRFPLEVVRAVREALGDAFPLLGKINVEDGFAGGLGVEDATVVARSLEAAEITGLVLSGGFTSRSAFYTLRGGRPLDAMIRAEPSRLQRMGMRVLGPLLVREYPFSETFFLPQARRIRAAVDLPLVLLGGVVSIDNLETAMAEGFEFVAMGRALIADPTLVNDMKAGRMRRTRCTSCNACVAEMDLGGVRCVLDD